MFPLCICFLLAVVPVAAQKPDLEKEKAQLLRLHAQAREAHFKTSVTLLQADAPEQFITVNGGRIDRITPDDEREFFEDYFRGATYLEWDDLEPPIVRVSSDASMAWVITRVKVRRTKKEESGAEREQSFTYAGIMTYEKRDGKWVRVANVSTFEASRS